MAGGTEPAILTASSLPSLLQVLCEDHVDNGLVTLSLITDNPSLEIHRIDGEFHMEEKSVSGAPTECIVWVGEQMEKITNAFYKPVRHRVVSALHKHVLHTTVQKAETAAVAASTLCQSSLVPCGDAILHARTPTRRDQLFPGSGSHQLVTSE